MINFKRQMKCLNALFFNCFLIVFFQLLNVSISYSQREITGSVLDDSNEPVIGATVRGENNEGAITDIEGQFSITLSNSTDSLTVTYVGYSAKSVSIDQQDYIEIILKSSELSIDQIVVTGYGVEEKKNVTAAISTVDAEEIVSMPQADVTEMLEGRMSGVQILSDNSPGGGNSIRVRGFGTVNNNEPLVIVDGTPVANGLNVVNPNDIETIQVLKDAASASVYGARASNGVVVITTKNGSLTEGSRVRYNGYYGVQNAFNLPTMLSAQGYGDMLWEAAANDGVKPDDGTYGNNPNQPTIPQYLHNDPSLVSANVDWVNAIFSSSPVQSHTVSLTRGGEQGSQYFSAGYFNQDGVIDYTGFERFQGRFNSHFNITDFIKVGQNLNASFTDRVSIATNRALGSIVYDAMQFPSIVPIQDANGEFGRNPLNDITNPLGRLHRNKDNNAKRIRLLGNVFSEISYQDITFRSQVGIDYQNYNQRNFNAIFNDITPSGTQVNSLNTSNNIDQELTITNILRYQKNFGLNNLDVLVGQEAIEHKYEGFSASRENFAFEEESFRYLNSGNANQRNEGDAFQWALASYFGKVNYNFDEKYLLTGTIRRDGTSRLSENKYDVFPAFSAGWRIDREDFFQENDILTGLMLRAGWGVTGNQQVPAYSTVSSFQTVSGYTNYDIGGNQTTVSQGLVKSRIANSDLKWERTNQTSFGLEANLLLNKLQITADYFNKTTQDVLVFATTPPTFGGTNSGSWINGGEMNNKGFELFVNYRDDLRIGLDYDVDLNFSTYKNEMTALNSVPFLGIPPSDLHSINFGQEVSRTMVGQPIGSFYGYRSLGVFQSDQEANQYTALPDAQAGDLKFADINSDGLIDDEDRTFIGSPHPDFILGFNSNFSYKSFDIGLFFNGSFGNDIYNLTKYKTHFANLSDYNKSSEIMNAWSESNPDASMPRLTFDDPNFNIRPSSYYIEDGSFFKLNQVDLGYTFKKLKAINIRIYAQANNLFTITNYSGLTPQIGTQNYTQDNRNLDIGVDRGLYPPSRTVSFGINLNY